MKKSPPLLRWCFALSVVLLLGGNIAQAQTEDPVQPTVKAIAEPAKLITVEGDIVPLFWKAKVDDTIVSVPLRNIEFFGVQAYVVDGATRVRELTITTKAGSFIRIYHIRPLKAADRLMNNMENLRKQAEGELVDEEERPVKIFPATTHAQMVEYRVSKQEDVDTLYEHLEKTMIDYHARYLTPELRGETVKSVEVD